VLLDCEGETRRGRIIDIDWSQDQILIGDFTGHLLASLSQRQYLQAREQQRFQLIPELSVFEETEPDLVPGVNALLLHSEQELKRRRHQQRSRREAEIEASITARRQQEASQRAEKIAKARAAQLRAQLEAAADQKIASLRSGALVQLGDAAGQLRPCYLALIDDDNDQYLFVDRQGRKLATHTRAELVQQLCDEQFKVMESGSALDHALQDLITERRQYLQEDEA
jgi:hypothetical protein